MGAYFIESALGCLQSVVTHAGTMTIWMKQMKRKTREAQAT